MKKTLFLALFLVSALSSQAQSTRSENVIVVTLDGMRWQEVFGGADSLLTYDSTARYNTGYVQKNFWAPTDRERREKLMPFFWSELAQKGVLLGNRTYGSLVNNANPYWFSYPGYNEIFTGYPDPAVDSNKKIPNPNETVFEYLNKLPRYQGKVASFASWDVFASIFNEKRSGILVNDGFRDVPGKLTEQQKLYNRLQHEMPALFHGSERLDVATFHMAMEYLKANKPRVLHIGLGDTDEFAHAGQYDLYLDAAQHADAWIRELWGYLQATPQYANKTTLLITTDHGRGQAQGGKWRDHGDEVPGAGEIWMAAIGPAIKHEGESKQSAQYQQGQIAVTLAKWLGEEFKPKHTVLPALPLGQ